MIKNTYASKYQQSLVPHYILDGILKKYRYRRDNRCNSILEDVNCICDWHNKPGLAISLFQITYISDRKIALNGEYLQKF